MIFDEVPEFFDVFPWQLCIVIMVLCIARAYLKGGQFKEPRTKAKGMVAIVTGASGGIGKQIARELNMRGAKVYMLCRRKVNGEEAHKALILGGCNLDRLILHTVDLGSFESIRAFAAGMRGQEEKVDILVNNAGIMLYPKFKLTEDGHELTWQTNYLGHFLLTELLLPLLDKSDGGRVINVSAMAHNYAEPIDTDTIDRREHFDGRQAYAKSKLAQVMHARELGQKLRRNASKTTINSCHPGLCYTRIMRYTPMGTQKLLSIPLAPFAWFLLKTPKDGAQTPLHLALSKHVDGQTGKYFKDMFETEASKEVTNEEACQALYNYSVDACRIGE